MRGTRRLWRALGVGLALLGLAVITGRPSLLAGACLVGAWVIADLGGFLRGLQETLTTLTVRQSLTKEAILTDEDTQLTLECRAGDPSRLPMRWGVTLPAGLDGDGTDAVALARGGTAASTTLAVHAPVAGSHEIPRPQGELTDPGGLATTTARGGGSLSVRVHPRVPRNIHVGQAGGDFGGAWGDHPADTQGAGQDPAELRQYVPGDPARRIDWRATARLGEPHVLEFEEETDRRLYCILDTRGALGEGPTGQRKLDYLREVGLGYVQAAEDTGDPLGIATVGDEGILERLDIDQTSDHYARATAAFADAEPTAATGAVDRRSGRDPGQFDSAVFRQTGDQFLTTLRPYLGEKRGYAHRVDSEPLAAAVRAISEGTPSAVWTVILTDDSNPAELRTAASIAQQQNRRVLLFLAPSVLFEPGGLADLEVAYDRYREFEELRRELDRVRNVTAYEVGPGDRFAAVLGRAGASRGRAGGT